MIDFEKFSLENGLRVIVHTDTSSSMVVVNTLYDVGARDEDEQQTGFAHLFEHLMFSGSINIPNFDTPLQLAGGENNAYTTNDITNYYIQIPKQNIETAFWLESDRMLSLAFSKKGLSVQKKVVCEEFKEHYISKPYGDTWKHLRQLAYTTHPYKWMTIGKELKHIENAQLDDVKKFFLKHYIPNNAILCIAGNITTEEVKTLAVKWFGEIPMGKKEKRNLPQEPIQQKERREKIYRDVPVNAIYKAWHICARLEDGFHEADLLTEILGSGYSSRLYVSLIKNRQLFSSINCYHTGSIEKGLLVIEGMVLKNIDIHVAEQAINDEIKFLLEQGITDDELEKAKHQIETMISFEDISLLARANNLAYYELLGDANMINTEVEKYLNVSKSSIMKEAVKIFSKENENTLLYCSQQTQSE